MYLTYHGQHTQHLDRPDRAGGDGLEANLAHVDGVIVAVEPSVGVRGVRILPRARKAAVVELEVATLELAQHALG